MRYLLFAFLFLNLSSSGQDKSQKDFHLTVSPAVDADSPVNTKIISTLKKFLSTKNRSQTQNNYWLASDFDKYIYPYAGIYNIEQSKSGPDFYKPTLMEIISTGNADKKIVKIAFIGHDAKTGSNNIKAIFNIVANSENENVVFSSYLDFATQNWQRKNIASVKYIISPQKKFNSTEADKQQQDINRICSFFDCKPIPVTYYSCSNPEELFRIKGFDYSPLMYVSQTGGLAEAGNIVFSANNSEYYTHEIVHVYVNNLYPAAPVILNEGIATYLGGSGLNTYNWHKNELKNYLKTSTIDFDILIDNPYQELYINNETPIAYITGALICEYIIAKFGKQRLNAMLQNENQDDIWKQLASVGFTRKNINIKITELLK